MKGLRGVFAGGLVLLLQGSVYPQTVAGSADDCVTCARWRSYQQADIHRFERGYLRSLRHDVDGVVESAIREVALIKMAQPGWDSRKVALALHDLAMGDRTLAVRIKAALAEAVMTEGIAFGDTEYRTDEEVFGEIVRQLHRQRAAITEREQARLLAVRPER